MYRQTNKIVEPSVATCPKCKSTRVQVTITSGSIFCKDCGELIVKTKRSNKYGAKRTEFNGKIYDSGFEADTAYSLEVRKKAGDIADYETQYKITAIAYRQDGSVAFSVSHKVDFRILHNDGSYELYEAKGIETDDYKWRRKFLENLWLPDHPDHIYTVVKDNRRRFKQKKY